MRPDPARVLQAYPLTVYDCRLLSWKEKKGVWRVRTDRGVKILKMCPSTESRLRFICRAVRHLKRNGVPIPDLVRTREGSDYAANEGHSYTLSDAVEGRSPEYGDSRELRLVMRTLGRFHLASGGFEGTGDGAERIHLGLWENSYRDQLDDLADFRRRAGKAGASDFDRLFLKHAGAFIERGEKALEALKGGSYRRWVNKVERQKNLCHQDFASGNLILDDEGLHVIDMDSLTFDLPARDLRKIFNKVLKKENGGTAFAISMLRAYHSANPLKEEEYGVLKADLLFPHLFYGIGSKYYKRRLRQGWPEEKLLNKLRAMIGSETAKMNMLSGWDTMLRSVTSREGGRP